MDVLELIKADHRLVESLSQKLRMLRTPINYTIALTSHEALNVLPAEVEKQVFTRQSAIA